MLVSNNPWDVLSSYLHLTHRGILSHLEMESWDGGETAELASVLQETPGLQLRVQTTLHVTYCRASASRTRASNSSLIQNSLTLQKRKMTVMSSPCACRWVSRAFACILGSGLQCHCSCMNFQELVVSEKTSDASGALAREGQVAVLITQIFKTGLWTVNVAVNCPFLSSVFHQWYFSIIILKSRSLTS